MILTERGLVGFDISLLYASQADGLLYGFTLDQLGA